MTWVTKGRLLVSGSPNGVIPGQIGDIAQDTTSGTGLWVCANGGTTWTNVAPIGSPTFTGTVTAPNVVVTGSPINTTPLIVNGTSGTTAPLQLWQLNGTTLLQIDSGGRITELNGEYVQSGGPTQVPLRVVGFAGQTANLFNVENSSNVVLARILSNGKPAFSESANGAQGLSAAMVAGTITVSNTSVTASSRILLTRQPGGANPGSVSVSSITAGTSFVITSTSATDTGQVAYLIMEPA